MAKSRKRRGKGDQFCLQARLVWKTAWSHRAPGLTVRAGVTPSSAQRDQVCKSAGKDAEHLLTMCVEGPAPQTWVSQGHHEAIIFTNTLSKPSQVTTMVPHNSNVSKKVNKTLQSTAPVKLTLYIMVKFHPELLNLQHFQPMLDTQNYLKPSHFKHCLRLKTNKKNPTKNTVQI